MLTLSPSVKGLWINGECSHGIKHAVNFPYVASNVIKNDSFFYINSPL